jgi:Zn-dependent M28 family amino/carboxypeptidase
MKLAASMVATLVLAGCALEGGSADEAENTTAIESTTRKPPKPTNNDPYAAVYAAVDKTKLDTLLRDMSGVNPVTVGGQTFSITNRYTPAAKADYRAYWTNYFQSLGLTVTPTTFPTPGGAEAQGHNLEAVLPGKTTDSVVIIVHYDSTGPNGDDNPGADDDMTGMAIAMETARILTTYPGRVHNTVRFVASDLEEAGGLAGARAYAKAIKATAAAQGFKLVASIDDEQSGWKEGANTIDMFDHNCSNTSPSSTALSTLLKGTATKYSTMTTKNGCVDANSDLYAMWEVGVPSITYGEHDPFSNPHFDDEGGDTYDKIAHDYFFNIAQVGVTFSTQVVGIDP